MPKENIYIYLYLYLITLWLSDYCEILDNILVLNWSIVLISKCIVGWVISQVKMLLLIIVDKQQQISNSFYGLICKHWFGI